MDEFEKIRQEQKARETASPEGKQMEAEKKVEETAKKVREGKIPAPTENDMGPLKKYKKGGKVKAKCKCMSSGGKVSSASKRADGCVSKGKTKGRLI